MAENADTLGSFKIKLETEGSDKVTSDIERVRNSLRDLQTQFAELKKGGQEAVDVLKNLSTKIITPVSTTPTGASPSPNNTGTSTPAPSTTTQPSDSGTSGKDQTKQEDKKSREDVGYIRRLLSLFVKSDKKHKDEFGKNLRDALRTGLNGNRGVDTLASGLGTVGSIASSLGRGPLGIAGLVIEGISWLWNREKRQISGGMNTVAELHRMNLEGRKFSIDSGSIESITKALQKYNAVYQPIDATGGQPSIDYNKTDAAARNQAGQELSTLQTQLAMYDQFGETPQWMKALWNMGIGTNGIEKSSDAGEAYKQLAKIYARAKSTLSERQFTALVASSGGLPKGVLDLAIDNKTADGIDEYFEKTGAKDTTIATKEGIDSAPADHAKIFEVAIPGLEAGKINADIEHLKVTSDKELQVVEVINQGILKFNQGKLAAEAAVRPDGKTLNGQTGDDVSHTYTEPLPHNSWRTFLDDPWTWMKEDVRLTLDDPLGFFRALNGKGFGAQIVEDAERKFKDRGTKKEKTAPLGTVRPLSGGDEAPIGSIRSLDEIDRETEIMTAPQDGSKTTKVETKIGDTVVYVDSKGEVSGAIEGVFKDICTRVTDAVDAQLIA